MGGGRMRLERVVRGEVKGKRRNWDYISDQF